MLSEILGEIDESPTLSVVKPKQPFMNDSSYMARKLAAKGYMKSFIPPTKRLSISKPSQAKATQKPQEILKEVQNNIVDTRDTNVNQNTIKNSEKKSQEETIASSFDSQIIEDSQRSDNLDSQLADNLDSQLLDILDSQLPDNLDSKLPVNVDSQLPANVDSQLSANVDSQLADDLTIENFTQDDFFSEDMDTSQIEEYDSQTQDNVDENIADVLQTEFMSEWETFTNQTCDLEVDKLLDKADIPLVEVEDKKVSADNLILALFFF